MTVMVPVLPRRQVAGRSRFISFCFSAQPDVRAADRSLSAGSGQQVLRGDTASVAFCLFHYKGDKLIAIDNVNASRRGI